MSAYFSLLSSPARVALIALSGLLVACAQPRESAALYDTSRENTHLEAQAHAMAGSPVASQWQIGIGGIAPAHHPAEGAGGAQSEPDETASATRPLVEARSFLGTVPCPPGMGCQAARFMVTLAPSGEWRSRTTILSGNSPGQNVSEQGCWTVIGTDPLRIALTHTNQEAIKSDLTFVNSNSVRVNAINGAQPMLEHRLTRQADVDPIDELKNRPALSCP